jgi:YD repeat-containing protein
MTQMASPQGYVTRMEYDLRDNLTKQTDSLGKSITSEFDRRNRLVRNIEGIALFALLQNKGF